MVQNHNSKWTTKVIDDPMFTPSAKDKQDMRALMSKWNADLTRNQLLNKLVKPNDTVKARDQISKALTQMTKNYDTFRLTDGFTTIGTALGEEKAQILAKEKLLQDVKARTHRERTPTYAERKKMLDEVNSQKMKNTINFMETISKSKNEVKLKHKQYLAEQKKFEELQKQKREQNDLK